MSLASTPFREAIVTRLSSLRDFLLLFFFITLGTSLDLTLLGSKILPSLGLSLFVLIGNPLIVLAIMGWMGYRKRTGFLAGLTVAQISEFSLVFIAMGLSLGHIKHESLGVVTLVGLITIALSVYMITYSHQLFKVLEPVLSLFERQHPYREIKAERENKKTKDYEVMLFGLGRLGKAIAASLSQSQLHVLGIDHNPEIIKQWDSKDCDVQFGDAHDQEFLHTLPIKEVRWIILAIPQHDTGVTHDDPRLILIDGIKRQGYQGRLAVSTEKEIEIEMLKAKGADLVFSPFLDAASVVVKAILDKDQGDGQSR
jgi:hypothetical protein